MMIALEPPTRSADASPQTVRPLRSRLQYQYPVGVALALVLCSVSLMSHADSTTADAVSAAAESDAQVSETAPPPGEASTQTSGEASTKALVERVQARWAAKLERDFETVYGFESPQYRAKNSAEVFAARHGGFVKWHGVTVGPVRYDDGDAIVHIDVDHTLPSPFGSGDIRQIITMTERWSRIDGTWYHIIQSRSPIGRSREANPTAAEREVEDDTDTN